MMAFNDIHEEIGHGQPEVQIVIAIKPPVDGHVEGSIHTRVGGEIAPGKTVFEGDTVSSDSIVAYSSFLTKAIKLGQQNGDLFRNQTPLSDAVSICTAEGAEGAQEICLGSTNRQDLHNLLISAVRAIQAIYPGCDIQGGVAVTTEKPELFNTAQLDAAHPLYGRIESEHGGDHDEGSLPGLDTM